MLWAKKVRIATLKEQVDAATSIGCSAIRRIPTAGKHRSDVESERMEYVRILVDALGLNTPLVRAERERRRKSEGR